VATADSGTSADSRYIKVRAVERFGRKLAPQRANQPRNGETLFRTGSSRSKLTVPSAPTQ